MARNPISASSLVQIKARVKAEMLRRSGTGSATSYGGTGYDYSTAPSKGQPVRLEHFNKIIEPVLAINDVGTHKKINAKEPLKDLGDISAFVTVSPPPRTS